MIKVHIHEFINIPYISDQDQTDIDYVQCKCGKRPLKYVRDNSHQYYESEKRMNEIKDYPTNKEFVYTTKDKTRNSISPAL